MLTCPDVWILTTAPASRAQDVKECHKLSGIKPEFRVVVTTQPNPLEQAQVDGHLVHFDSDELNISKWWNAGLRYIRSQYKDPQSADFHILIAEADIRINGKDIARMSTHLDLLDMAVAGANWYDLPLEEGEYLVSYTNKHWGEDERWRFPGVGFLIDGSLMLEFDERFRWWYADCDMLFQHREFGGSVLVGGTSMKHTGTTVMDAQRLQMASEDKIKFMNKWDLERY